MSIKELSQACVCLHVFILLVYVCFAVVSSTSGVVVAILSVIMVVSLLILTLFCYKDKMKLLSGNGVKWDCYLNLTVT